MAKSSSEEELLQRLAALEAEVQRGKEERQRLAEVNDRLSHLISAIPAVIYACRPEGDFPATFVSDNVATLMGYVPGDFIEQPSFWADHIHPEDKGRIFAALSQVFQNNYHIHEYRFLHRDGSYRWMRDEMRLYRDDDGKPFEIVGTWLDVTSCKEAEQDKEMVVRQLRQAQKMEALGTLAGGVAHEFNNILAVILGYTEMAVDDVPEWSRTRANLAEVVKAAHRAKDVVQQILAFSRKSEQQLVRVAPGRIVDGAMTLVRASLPSSIKVVQRIDPACGTIAADSTQFHQALINLCLNATHAMEEKGGELTVGLDNVVLETPNGGPCLPPGRYVRLTVRDTGCGMDQATRERLFEPFFTTKEIGKGTGMGLAVVHAIVESHGGSIVVDSLPGKGSEFQLFFPAVTPGAAEEEAAEPLPRGSVRILVVDDEELVLRIMRSILAGLGYQVTAMIDSVAALDLFRVRPHAFDLVITDQTMPQLSGSDLARAMLAVRPDLPIILCTGYSSRISEEEAKTMGIREFFLKPIDRRHLARVTRQVLDER